MGYSLFLFRRDLRLQDNLGLQYALQHSKKVLPIFIFTPEQVKNNSYKSERAVEFMVNSLLELNRELKSKSSKLHVFYGENLKVLAKITRKLKIESIFFNRDYTPYARKRDKKIETFCKKKEIKCPFLEDYLFHPMGTLLKKDQTPYLIFTPFKKNGKKRKVPSPLTYSLKNLTKTNHFSDKIPSFLPKSNLVAGRKYAKKLLSQLKEQKQYNKKRNCLTHEATRLSASIKFGTVSIREVYWKIRKTLGSKTVLIDQLFWREFYYYIVYYFPRVLGHNFNKRYNKIKWETKHLKVWQEARTGYPIVDAGMTQLNQTGYLPNRARLITANFMNRMLGLNWQWGEKYYAQQLIDYDPAVNNGNWQWVASTGVDPKPYFQRLFNPWLQGKRFDPKAEYIKKWLPNLKDIPAKELLQWDLYYEKYDLTKLNYYKPIVKYSEARKRSVFMYRRV